MRAKNGAARIASILLATAFGAQLFAASPPLLAAEHKEKVSPAVQRLWDSAGKLSRAGKLDEAAKLLEKATALAPQSAYGWNQYYIVLERADRLREAEKAIRRAHDLEPDNAVVLTNLGNFLCRNDEHKKAIPVFERAVKIDPKEGDAWYSLGLLYAEALNLRAKTCLENALALQPKNDGAHTALAYVLRGMKNYKESELHYRKAIALNRRNIEAWDGLMSFLVTRKRESEIAKLLDDFSKVQTDVPGELVDMSVVYFKWGKLEEAKRCLKRAQSTRRPRSVIDEIQMGVALRRMGQLAESEKCLRRALQLNSTSAMAMHELGITLSKRGKSHEATKYLRIATHLRPDDATIFNDLATTLFDVGEYKESEEVARKACRIHSTPETLSLLALILFEKEKFKEAEDYAKLAVAAGPGGSFQALNNLGLIKLNSGDALGAEPFFKEALVLDPGSSFAWQNLGLCLFRRGDKEGAILYIKRSIGLNPTALAWRNLAFCLESVNDKKGAADALLHAMALSESANSKYTVPKQLNRLQSDQSRGAIKAGSDVRGHLGAGTLIPRKLDKGSR